MDSPVIYIFYHLIIYCRLNVRFNMQSCVHSFFFFFCPTDRPTFTRGRTMGNETFYWDGLSKYEIARARGEVWRHVTMEAKFLNLDNLSWRRQSFALSNDERIVWTTVLFLSAIIYSKVIHVNFFVFFSVIFEGPRFVEIHGNVTERIVH